MKDDVNMYPYVIRFSITYIVALLVLMILTVSLGGTKIAGGSMAALMVAACVAVIKFVKDQGREPDRAERKKLTIMTLGVSLVVQAIVLTLLFKSLLLPIGVETKGPVDFLLIAVICLIFVAVVQAVALWFGYGWFARMYDQSLRGKENCRK
ncbi:MAG: ABZJ_00895 family protein [bacterium]|nr:ABZJ_00895 family protein [bacterium]